MVQIINYDAGNLTSVQRALDFLEIKSRISADPDEIRAAERIIFPGVGHAKTSIEVLKKRGLAAALVDAFNAETPILGICLGTQIVLSHSDEGDAGCLGIMEGNCPRFDLDDPSLKIPHMGWDSIRVVQNHPVLKDVEEGDEFYFVHSFYPLPADEKNIYATCEYGTVFPAVIGMKNLFAVQFHPEKSGRTGLKMLKNFIEWDGRPC